MRRHDFIGEDISEALRQDEEWRTMEARNRIVGWIVLVAICFACLAIGWHSAVPDELIQVAPVCASENIIQWSDESWECCWPDGDGGWVCDSD